MTIAVVGEAAAVAPIVQLLDDTRRFGPLRAGGRLRHFDRPGIALFDEHRERELFPVGRPGERRGCLFDSGDLGSGAFGVHPSHEDLGPFGLTLRDEGDAIARGRPARGRSLRKEPVAAAVGVHDPQRGLALVVDLVDPAAGVDDLRAVRGELRLGDRLQIEIEVERQAVGLRSLVAGVLGALRGRHVAPDHHETE